MMTCLHRRTALLGFSSSSWLLPLCMLAAGLVLPCSAMAQSHRQLPAPSNLERLYGGLGLLRNLPSDVLSRAMEQAGPSFDIPALENIPPELRSVAEQMQQQHQQSLHDEFTESLRQMSPKEMRSGSGTGDAQSAADGQPAAEAQRERPREGGRVDDASGRSDASNGRRSEPPASEQSSPDSGDRSSTRSSAKQVSDWLQKYNPLRSDSPSWNDGVVPDDFLKGLRNYLPRDLHRSVEQAARETPPDAVNRLQSNQPAGSNSPQFRRGNGASSSWRADRSRSGSRLADRADRQQRSRRERIERQQFNSPNGSSGDRTKSGNSPNQQAGSPASVTADNQSKSWLNPDKLVNSLVNSFDETAASFVKQLQDDPESMRWAADFLKAAQVRVASLNQSVTRTVKQSAAANSSRANQATSIPNGRTTTPSLPQLNGVIGIGLLLIVGIGAAIYAWSRWSPMATVRQGFTPSGSWTEVQDRSSLLAACHQLALRDLGTQTRFWHHRQLFRAWAGERFSQADSIYALARLYESSRYAPGNPILSTADLRVARDHLRRIA